jgi:Ankyrin repeat
LKLGKDTGPVSLLSDRCAFRSDFQAQACHREIAEGCLRYLLYLSKHAPLTKEVVDQHPLARYAAEHWWQHARNVDGADGRTVINLSLKLLTVRTTVLLSWVQLYNIDRPWVEDMNPSLTSIDVAQPPYYAASVGVVEVVKNILPQRVNVNAHGGLYGNALQVASINAHEEVVQMLLNAGADVNAQGGFHGNALQVLDLVLQLVV